MAVNFENLVIDQVDQVVFQNANNAVIGAVNQLEDLSINVSSESKDKTDARGVLIKRFYTAKAVEVSGNNALTSLDTLAMQFGTTKKIATAANKIVVPMILQFAPSDFVKATDTYKITLPNGITPLTGTIVMNNLTTSGIPDSSYAYTFSATTPDTQKKAKLTTTAVAETGATIEILTADYTAAGFAGVQVMFEYEADGGILIDAKADAFPATCKATFSVLCVDPCDTETLRHAYVVFPSFQVSPDVDWSLTTDATQPFSGVAQVDYCSTSKRLFYIVMSDDDIVE